MTKKQQKIEQLNQQMFSCQNCILRKTCKQVVPGEGNANSEILFIGEGPGKNEDEQGRPFVGAAGKFLDEMLASVNLERKDIYIANVVKCRPENNRDPFPDEVQTCWQWLEKQIEIIQPKLIVTLGRHSMERFIENQKISQVHGKVFRREIENLRKQVFCTLYHPAMALYNGGMRETLLKDFKKIPKILEKLKEKE